VTAIRRSLVPSSGPRYHPPAMSPEFPETMWTLMLRAAEGSRASMGRLAGIYQPVLLHLARSKGFPDADAEDLAQEVLCVLCQPEFLGKADREKGRFRELLFGVARNKMREAWRKRRRRELPLTGDIDAPDEPGLEAGFNRLWKEQLLREGLARLEREQRESPHPPYFTVLSRHKLHGVPLADLARELGTGLENVKNWSKRAKERLATHVRQVIASYSSSRDEFDGEVRLFGEAAS